MKYIFTKQFFRLSAIDQSGIVDAAMRDLDQCWLSQEDEDRAKRKRQQIEKKAIKYGILADCRGEV
jgi:hypothetical protein